MSDHLASWHDTDTRRAIVDFVERVTNEAGDSYVPPAERIAVFDNDGTLWCEKPMPIELGFILMRLVDMAEADESLRGRQPWKAAHDKDYSWLGEAITKHYHGDDSDVKHQATMDVCDDGPVKPVRIWSRIGQRPIIAGGNSNGHIPMLRYAGGKERRALRLLLLHDDDEREFAYTAGAESSLQTAAEQAWTVVSIKNDWATVFSS